MSATAAFFAACVPARPLPSPDGAHPPLHEEVGAENGKLWPAGSAVDEGGSPAHVGLGLQWVRRQESCLHRLEALLAGAASPHTEFPQLSKAPPHEGVLKSPACLVFDKTSVASDSVVLAQVPPSPRRQPPSSPRPPLVFNQAYQTHWCKAAAEPTKRR